MNIPMRPGYETFAQLVRRESQAIPLALAALEIARPEYPHLDVMPYLRRIEFWAYLAEREMGACRGVEVGLATLNQILFEEEGFQGDVETYYSPENCYLHRVMDRRRGIPVTLAVLYLEVGWRIGLPLEGINFPSHFLVRARLESGEHLLLDPFQQGQVWSERQPHWWHPYLGEEPYDPSWMEVADNRGILFRILGNLKGAYERRSDWRRMLRAIEQRLILRPGFPPEVRELGMAAFRLGDWERCLECFEEYLALEPNPPDGEKVRQIVEELRHLVGE